MHQIQTCRIDEQTKIIRVYLRSAMTQRKGKDASVSTALKIGKCLILGAAFKKSESTASPKVV